MVGRTSLAQPLIAALAMAISKLRRVSTRPYLLTHVGLRALFPRPGYSCQRM